MSLIYDALKNAEVKRKQSKAISNVLLADEVDNDAAILKSVEKQSDQSNDVDLFMQDRNEVEAQLLNSLQTSNKITSADIAKIKRMQEEKPNVSLLVILTRLGLVSDADIAFCLHEILEIPLIRKEQYPCENIVSTHISERFLKEQKILPLTIDNHSIKIVMSDPLDFESKDAIAIACDREVVVSIGIASEIENGIEQILGDKTSQMNQILSDVTLEDISEEEVDHLKDLASEAPVIRLVNLLIQKAIEDHASDIHIEPFEGLLKVRYRVDGVLKEVESPPKQFSAAVISRVKIMAKLDIAERRLPQDGRIRSRLQGKDFDMRISTIPTMHGESVVIRLLNQESVVLDFDALGFSKTVKAELHDVLNLPHGMLLITGPTGSGKTTTLYTALSYLNQPNRKIITVEDPIEYQLEGINQIQAKSSIGLNFANALRSIVRQDPDVIMVGEMRDTETAEICIKSALTGHFVLSTLHTNDAASSITRLIEMRVEDYLLTSTLNAVLAQRLVRVLCNHCKKPSDNSQKFIEDCQNHNVKVPHNVQIYQANGCPECGNTGYMGRTCIVEFLRLNENIKKKILDHTDANELTLLAVENGMQTMYQDGLNKVLNGITTVEEVTRVTREL